MLRIIRKFSLVLLFFLPVTLWVGCAEDQNSSSSNQTSEPDAQDTPDVPESRVQPQYQLFLTGDAQLTLEAGEREELGVFVETSDGARVDDIDVDFEIAESSDPAIALDRRTSRSGSSSTPGYARVHVDALAEGVSTIRISSNESETVLEVTVEVLPALIGHYTLTAHSNAWLHGSKKSGQSLPFDRVDSYLYDTEWDGGCDALESELHHAGIDQQSLRRARPAGAISESELSPLPEASYASSTIVLPLASPEHESTSERRQPFTYAIAYGIIGADTIAAYDCVKVDKPSQTDGDFRTDIDFELQATYPNLDQVVFDITSHIDMTSALSPHADEVLDQTLAFLADPAGELMALIGEKLFGNGTYGPVVDAVLQELASTIFKAYTDEVVVDVVMLVAANLRNALHQLELRGTLQIDGMADHEGYLTGNNLMTIDTIALPLADIPGLAGPVEVNVEEFLSSDWVGQIVITGRTSTQVKYALVVDPVEYPIVYREQLERLLVAGALAPALGKEFSDFVDVAEEYLDCEAWIEAAACAGKNRCARWQDAAEVACIGARELAIVHARRRLDQMTGGAEHRLTLETHVSEPCPIVPDDTRSGAYQYNDYVLAEVPEQALDGEGWCRWIIRAESLHNPDNDWVLDGEFFAVTH